MSIECVNYKEYQTGSLQGFCTIFVEKWGVEIKGCSIYTKGHARWFKMPSKEFTNDEDEKCWSPLIKFKENEHRDAFCKLALEAVDRFCAENNTGE